MVTKRDILGQIKVGHRVAEDEIKELENYFVKTSQWTKLSNGDIDVIYGAKGTGKSALYSLLIKKGDKFNGKGILTIPAENPLGASAFQSLIDENMDDEVNLTYIWKLYIIQLICTELRKHGLKGDITDKLVLSLEEAKLLPKSYTLSSLFARAKAFVQSFSEKETSEVEYTIGLDSDSGMPVATRRAKYNPADPMSKLTGVPVDDLLSYANNGLRDSDVTIWLLFDRLDVSFSSSPALERSALRALFRVYSDLKPLDNIKAKIFVRRDIWERITEGGFREASHIIKTDLINWDRDGLLNLIVNRLVNNQILTTYLSIDKQETIEQIEKQKNVLDRIFPNKVDTGKNPDSFDWIISRVQDGSKQTAPRELIHMLECMIANQLKKLEQGKPEPENEMLFERNIFKESLKTVSKVRYEQTFCAEYPDLKNYTELLKGEKSEQSIDSLSKIWNTTIDDATNIADKLVASGFFELRSDKGKASYWVPFLYRDALELIRGKSSRLSKQ
ncbi:P-loop ATPase, Sll1717 family [Citrobacter freundii]|uniref:P-loop ATPase, Sll1717 family n=1 Tax=Citrobacter freundii TaxID=546 RepID=UPI00110DA9F9|nr:hypothetical protein [Citrobacter freundii]QCW57444.1 hypothetical protein FGF61_25935 [Citrobacter freundii]